MSSVVSAITKTVPISQFNRGLAGQIFSDVKSNGPKVVIKNNTAEVVLISSKLISGDEMKRRLGITQEELDSIDEVEFE